MSNYYNIAVKQQAKFRNTSSTISDEGRSWEPHKHILATDCEEENLYPALRGDDGARKFFGERGISWHHGGAPGGSGPTRNLASSQVACINFFLPLCVIPGALTAVMRAIDDDVKDIVSIYDEGRESLVEFEWIGLCKSLEGGTRRGQYDTSVDSFMIAETDKGLRAYLMEWKYTEKGGDGDYMGEGRQGEVRWPRYATTYSSRCSSFGTANGVVPMNELLYEPFYQLMRNRLLGDRMVKMRELDVSDAKVIVVVPKENTTYREHITSPPLAERFPDLNTVDELIRATLKNPDAAFKMVTQTELVEAVERECGDAVSDWAEYIRERYGW